MTADAASPADVRAVAIRFADLWAVDHHQMVDEIYDDDIEMYGMAKPGPGVRGAAELHQLEDRLAALIPEHRHELVRVLVDGNSAFLETTVVAPVTREYSQAAVWWTLDATGKVSHEIGWFDWEHRTEDSRRSRGAVPPDDRRQRGSEVWRRLLDDALLQWHDMPSALAALCTEDCTVDLIGRSSWTGIGAVARAAHAAAAVAPDATVLIERTVADGAVLAALVHVTAEGRTTRGTIVVTLGRDDRVAGVRVYVDWTRAAQAHDR